MSTIYSWPPTSTTAAKAGTCVNGRWQVLPPEVRTCVCVFPPDLCLCVCVCFILIYVCVCMCMC
jgi:hypothetical protein